MSSSIRRIPFLLAIILCFNGLRLAHAYRIRGRAIEAYASYPDPSTTAASSSSTTATFPTLVLPPDYHPTAFPPSGYPSGTANAFDSFDRGQSKAIYVGAENSAALAAFSSAHSASKGVSIDSNAVAATTPSSAFSRVGPPDTTSLVLLQPEASGFQPQTDTVGSIFPPAFLTGLSPPLSQVSGSPTSSMNYTLRIPEFRPAVVLRPAFAMAPTSATPEVPQQTAMADTQSPPSAVTPALVGAPVSPQTQADVEIGGATTANFPVHGGPPPGPVAKLPAQLSITKATALSPAHQPAALVISSVPSSSAVVAGDQSLANNGPPAVTGGQAARVSDGSITSTESVPHAQGPQTNYRPDLIAGSLTFVALSSGPAAQNPPTPVVGGGLTISAASTNTPVGTSAIPAEPNAAPATAGQPTVATVQPIAAPVQPNAAPAKPEASPVQPVAVPVGSNAAPAQPNALPVVVGGVTYAPAQPSTQVAVSAVAGSNVDVPSGGAGPTLGQPKAITESNTPSAGTNPGPALANPVAKQPGQEGSRPAQPDRTLGSGNAIPGQTSQIPGNEPPAQGKGDSPMATNPAVSHANDAPVVLGGITYTPVAAQHSAQAANPTPLSLADVTGVTTQPATGPQIENGGTIMPVQAGAPAPTLVGIVGGQTIYRQGSSAIVGSQTVAQGSASILVDNTPVALEPSAIVIGTITTALPPANPQVAATPMPVGVVGGQPVYRQGSVAIVGSQTVTQGNAPVSVHNTPVALGPSAIVIGMNTMSLTPSNPQTDTAPTLVGVVGGQTIYRQGSSAIIGSQTIVQGSVPITVDNTPVALGPSAIVVGTNTIPLPPENVASTTPAVYSFGGAAVTQGGAPVTISGTEYSLGPSFVVEGTKTIPISSAAPSNPVLTIAGQAITANPTGFSIGGTSVSPNGPAITVSGTVVSLNPSGVIIGSSTSPFPSPAATNSVMTIGSHTFTALPTGGFQIDNSTLLPGSSAVVISSTTYSINSASALVIGTSTIPLATTGPSPNAALTAGAEAFTPLDNTAVMMHGTTLSLSGPAITNNGTILSLATGGIVIGPSTYAFPTPAPNAAVTTPSIFTINSNTFTASGSGLAIAGTEIYPGSSAVVVAGTPISLGATALVVGTSTVPLASVTGLGPALSGSNVGSAVPAPSAGLGTKARDESEILRVMIVWAAVMGLMLIWV